MQQKMKKNKYHLLVFRYTREFDSVYTNAALWIHNKFRWSPKTDRFIKKCAGKCNSGIKDYIEYEYNLKWLWFQYRYLVTRKQWKINH